MSCFACCIFTACFLISAGLTDIKAEDGNALHNIAEENVKPRPASVSEIGVNVSRNETTKPSEVPNVKNASANQTVSKVPSIPTNSNIANVIANVTLISSNDTDKRDDSLYQSSITKLTEHLNLDTGAVKRTFYVIAGLTGVVVLYFMVKGITLRRKHRIPRYGLLAERELENLDDGDDEDEDMTLFDARYKKKGRGP